MFGVILSIPAVVILAHFASFLLHISFSLQAVLQASLDQLGLGQSLGDIQQIFIEQDAVTKVKFDKSWISLSELLLGFLSMF